LADQRVTSVARCNASGAGTCTRANNASLVLAAATCIERVAPLGAEAAKSGATVPLSQADSTPNEGCGPFDAVHTRPSRADNVTERGIAGAFASSGAVQRR